MGKVRRKWYQFYTSKYNLNVSECNFLLRLLGGRIPSKLFDKANDDEVASAATVREDRIIARHLEIEIEIGAERTL